MFLAYTFACLMAAYLNVIIAIVMQIKHTVNFTIHVDVNVVDALDTSSTTARCPCRPEWRGRTLAASAPRRSGSLAAPETRGAGQ